MRWSLLKDERGAWSSARIGMWSTLLFTWHYIVTRPMPSTDVLSLLGGTLLGFMAWAGGPRAMQYLGPQVGALAQGIASAKPPYPAMDENEKGDDD